MAKRNDDKPDGEWDDFLSDLPEKIRKAGDTTASTLADKTDIPLIDKLQAKGWLGRILIAAAAAVLLLLMFGCTTPAPVTEETRPPALMCMDGMAAVIDSGQAFVLAIPCRVIGTYTEDEALE